MFRLFRTLNWWPRRDHARRSWHSDATNATVRSLALEFWPCDPELCFHKLKRCSAELKISPSRRLRLAMWFRVFPAQYASRVLDITILRPLEAPYKALKTELKNRVCLPFKTTTYNYSSFCTWKTLVTDSHHNFYGICWSLAEVQSEMLLMMRFFASFSCRNFHSPFAALLPCTKMSASVSSPRTLHTTWRKSRVLKQSINSSTRVILKLGQLKPSYRGSGKRCRCLHQCMNSHSLAPSLTFVGTTNDSAWKV